MSAHLPYLLLGTEVGGFVAQLIKFRVRGNQILSEPVALDVGTSEFLVKLLIALG